MRAAAAGPRALVDDLAARRAEANAAFFAAEAERTARLCHAVAERFAGGGRLVALGCSAQARSDARHVAVEFVHPVIVGKRALPAFAVCGTAAEVAAEASLLCRADDVVLGFDAPVGQARESGCLTLSYSPGLGAEWEFAVPTDDSFVAQEVAETHYHVLWELCHVFFEHRGLLAGRTAKPVHDPGASSFLYPFLVEAEDDLDAVLADVARSVLMKSEEVGELRARTLDDREGLVAAATAIRGRLDAGGTLLALGNGGSATDAADAVADLLGAPKALQSRGALDLTADPGILTAIANDVGAEEIFQRQVIAYGAEGDALLAFSTSGGSPNVLAALTEARRRGLLTVAFVGYDGGRVAAEELADHVIVTRSENIPRIQEAQAAAWHVLRELMEVVS